MRYRVLLSLLLVALALPAMASVADAGADPGLAERATAQAERIRDVGDYLTGVNDAVELARAGEYGRIKRRDIERLESSRDRIAGLLDGQASALDLPIDERIQLYNAQESISAILRNDEKNRMVCRRVANTGTRIPTTECLTVAEREARARGARRAADHLPRPTCVPDQGAGC